VQRERDRDRDRGRNLTTINNIAIDQKFILTQCPICLNSSTKYDLHIKKNQHKNTKGKTRSGETEVQGSLYRNISENNVEEKRTSMSTFPESSDSLKG
jgi:hypothetical protein